MASLIVRNLSDALKAKLKIRAAHNGRSMEEEVRVILSAVLSEDPPAGTNLAEQVHRRFANLGGFDLPEIAREPVQQPAWLDD
ncbi:FitA-like ribbon-helix-helix domain-containing protein [Gloeobacter kilaueensis]|uniref:Bifunctional phosphopantothenoylcysteine decarboxylase/phosphopantothenate synthase n=1 Tax=Gloeobacter kilaueensis (strain ATCC BAA-2537 / CCAP 1431/1 / ULC 316 / JS1) TaxID=1183438 RepID=U5QL39_GLOK1|nr:phosphopantothenoylcysteine decarboxylase [Gloeobacter kilaueensis]AGY58299.1 bifunctional phosphopantothenoylcysteine decarboxylase/phosphopantothenate synthase [Gloeobacter kilaueensis JS1]